MSDPGSCAHIPCAIQPHGVLVVVDAGLSVVMVSANCEELLGVPARRALDLSLAELVGGDLADAAGPVARQVSAGLPAEPLVLTLGDLAEGAALGGVDVDVRVHASGERVVLEIEPLSRVGATGLSYQSARGAMARLAGAASVIDLMGALAREIRSLLEFDRVLIHRFDEEGRGEVVAEERRSDLVAFLALPHPDTDSPAGPQGLDTARWNGLIADVDYRPVPLHPVVDPDTGRPLDLSHATLRSASPAQVEHLSHLGVTASMSIPLVVEDRLWGLVACHHHSGPHRPTHDARAAAEFLAQVASQIVSARERAHARDMALATQSAMSAAATRISASPEPPLKALIGDPALLDLMQASGAALCYDGELTTRGDVVDEPTLRRIAAALEDPEQYATATDRVRTLDPDLADVPAIAAGALRIGSAPDRWLLWLRPEVEKESRAVRGRSEPWTRWQLDSADALGKHMIGLLLMRSREHIAMAESLQRSVVLDLAPSFPGVEIVARYLPASSYQLGGDWWDAFELTDGRLAFVVGDVAGHGVSAASAMTQVRTALRAYVFEGHDPGVCLDRLDHLMSELLDQRVATAVVALLDVASGTIELSSAGHPPPLLVHEGVATQIHIDARPLLGVGAGSAGVTVLRPPPGSTLLLYTDGLVERRGADTSERIAELGDLAAATRTGVDLETWVDGLVQVAEVADDDTTILAIHLRGAAGPGS